MVVMMAVQEPTELHVAQALLTHRATFALAKKCSS
jgi:hypothetical protein